jgi:hypothetical protein
LPWSEAEQYLDFLREYGIEPERLNNWPAYDVWMIMCAKIIEHINSTNEIPSDEEQDKFNQVLEKYSDKG